MLHSDIDCVKVTITPNQRATCTITQREREREREALNKVAFARTLRVSLSTRFSKLRETPSRDRIYHRTMVAPATLSPASPCLDDLRWRDANATA